jgi:hypothetical protein
MALKRTATDVHELYGPCPGTTPPGFLQTLSLGPLLSIADLWRFSSVHRSLGNSRDATEVIMFRETTMLSLESVRALLVAAARLPKLRVLDLGFRCPGLKFTRDMVGSLRTILDGRHLRECCVGTVQMAADAGPLTIPKQLRIWKLLVNGPTHGALDDMWKLAACDQLVEVTFDSDGWCSQTLFACCQFLQRQTNLQRVCFQSQWPDPALQWLLEHIPRTVSTIAFSTVPAVNEELIGFIGRVAGVLPLLRRIELGNRGRLMGTTYYYENLEALDVLTALILDTIVANSIAVATSADQRSWTMTISNIGT